MVLDYIVIIGLILLGGHLGYLYYLIAVQSKMKPFGRAQVGIAQPEVVEGTADYLISVIIPVRNEARHILALLQDLDVQTLDSRRYEVLVMDDFSTDGTAELVHDFAKQVRYRLRCLASDVPPDNMAYKKRSITLGIAASQSKYVITTDGDCRVGPDWLRVTVLFLESKRLVMAAGMVAYQGESTWHERFQGMDFGAWVAVGSASMEGGVPNLCNGANLAYLRTAFEQVGGFTGGADRVASGDDEFLMHKMVKVWPEQVRFLYGPDTVVWTQAQPTLKALLHQRLRWAGKWRRYQNPRVVFTGGYYILTYSSLAIGLYGGWCAAGMPYLYLAWLALKYLPEWWFLSRFLKTARKPFDHFGFFLYQIGVGPYILLLALLGLRKGYVWKGRRVT